jgi:hypothetical protein
MYSMPQQAVTNGYWKMEYLRAQPTTRSSLEVKNPGPASGVSDMVDSPCLHDFGLRDPAPGHPAIHPAPNGIAESSSQDLLPGFMPGVY